MKVIQFAPLVFCLVACGHGQKRGPSGPTGLIRINAEVADAGVWVDDVFIGTANTISGGVRLSAGPHRLELRHDDYFTRYVELEVTTGEPLVIDVDFAPRLP